MLSDYERGTIVSLVKWVSISAVVLGAIWWFSYMMYAPHQKLSHEQMAAFEKPRLAVAGVLQEYLVEARKARSDTGLEQALGDLIGQPEASKESSRTDDFFTPIPTGIPGARITVYDQLGTPRSIPETDLRAALGGG